MTAESLRQGARLALANAWRLLNDSVTLLQCGSAPSSLALAVLASEEIGRHFLLLALATDVERGRQLSLNDLRQALDDHEVKLRHGLGFETLAVPARVVAEWRLRTKRPPRRNSKEP